MSMTGAKAKQAVIAEFFTDDRVKFPKGNPSGEDAREMRFVIMGVSGCGKSSVGAALAQQCGVVFVDGDDLHSPTNIRKMSEGIPLNDADRAPWLEQIGRKLAPVSEPTAIGCSALKRHYRDSIRLQAGGVHFVHLHAPQKVLAKRVAAREGHFMPPSLLDSQYRALQLLQSDEQGVVINIDQPFGGVVADTVAYVRLAIEGAAHG